MHHFPPLRMAVLSAMIDLKGNLDALDSPDCPYDNETKETLRSLLAPIEVEKIVEKEVYVQGRGVQGRPSKNVELSDDDKTKLTEQIQTLIEALDTMGTGAGLETNERIQIVKTKSGLLKELLAMRERNTAAQKVEDFMENVISILNDFVSEGDRATFLKRLEPFR